MPRLSAAPISLRTKSRSSWIRDRPRASVSSHVRPLIGTITPALPTSIEPGADPQYERVCSRRRYRIEYSIR